MASEENARTNRVKRTEIFKNAIKNIVRANEKDQNLKKLSFEQHKPESCSEELDSSKGSANKHATDSIKECTADQEKVFSRNDKVYGDHTKQFSDSKKPDDQNEDTLDCSKWTAGNSKSENSSNNSNEHLKNSGHRDDSGKSSGWPKTFASNDVDHGFADYDNTDSNSEQYIGENNTQIPKSTRNYSRPNSLNSNSYSHTSGKSSFRKFSHNKHFSNSKQPDDQNEDTPDDSKWISGNSKSQNSCNNSNEPLMIAKHDDGKEKYSGWPKILPSNDGNHKFDNYINRGSNSRQYVDGNSMQMHNHIRPYNRSNSLNSSSYSPTSDIKNSTDFNSSDISSKKFDRNCSNFNRNSNFQKTHPYKERNSNPHYESYKSRSQKNYPRNNSYSDAFDAKSSYKCHNFKMLDKKEDFFRNDLSKSHSYHYTKENNFPPHRHHDSYNNSFTKNNPRYNSNSNIYDTKSSYHTKNRSYPDDKQHMSIELDRKNTVTINKESIKDRRVNEFPNAPASPALSAETISVSSTPISLVLNSSPLSEVPIDSLYFSPVSTPENSSKLLLPPEFNDNIGMLIPSDDNFIPPPTSCESSSTTDKLYSSAEKDVSFVQSSETESTEVYSYEDEADFSLPDSDHLEAISNFIDDVVKARSVDCSVADKVVRDLNTLFKTNFEGNVIEYYGSYDTKLAITTSDINLFIKATASIRKSDMYEIYKVLSKELEKYHVHQFEEGTTAHKIKINFTHPGTGINCELAYLGTKPDKVLKMGKFLKEMCCLDKRVRLLIITTKVWAEHYNINEVEEGRLHPIGFALLVIHFLQHCENPVLPLYSPEKLDENDRPPNDSCVGALWIGFLLYYSYIFNWQEDIVTVTSLDRVSKKSEHWENYWIAIKNPFTEKNIAESVTNKDVADRIKACFKQTYHYFLNGQASFSDEDNGDGDQSSNTQLEFSFNDCVLEQNEDICEMCEEIDDLCDECKKKEYIQPMASVPKMTDDFLEVIKRALLTVSNKYMLSDKEVDERKQFVSKLEKYIHKLYPKAKMKLFGSSANGFGFKKSDLDINLTFETKVHDAPAVLISLRRHLRKNHDFVDVIGIFNAQIPVLKFRYKPTGWRGDISLDNVLAIHNSELLYTYTQLDKRCQILGCALKLIAKKALIAETTEKALSSYSYAIMVICFLQQTDPPVLPVLQDVQFRNNFELDHVVENCNVWFCQDIDYIKKIFKNENQTPVEQLFLELLDYYCSFDRNSVITIRQKEIVPLSSCEKMRAARLFNIQDPFLVDKNLGTVVSPAKAQETMRVLNNTRMLFRTPKKDLATDEAHLEEYFFSTMGLTGRIQKEVLCDLCGKFGHDEKGCRQTFTLKNNLFFQRKTFKPFPRKNQYENRNNFKSNPSGFFKMNK